MNKIRKSIFIKSFLAMFIIVSIFSIQVLADEEINNIVENEEIENDVENDDKIKDLESQKRELEDQSDLMNAQIEFIEGELSETVLEITELSQNIFDKNAEMQELETKALQLNEEAKVVNSQLEIANQDYDKIKSLMEARLVAMYEIGDISYLDLLLNSKGIFEFISNYYYISIIADADSELLQTCLNKKQSVESLIRELEKNEQNLNDIQENLKKDTIALSNFMAIKNQKLKNLNAEELNLQQKIEEYQSQIQSIESEIKILALASNNSDYVGGSFAWPVPGYSKITSNFGMRTHPITGIYKLHTGVDIGAPLGAAFIASNNGIVVKAEYNTAYGNMVIVDHGGGISTLYAHGSEILTSVGQTITKGTPILKVGSTGYSTGPHAHFEIRVNGEYVNPLDYMVSNTDEQNIETEIVEIEEN